MTNTIASLVYQYVYSITDMQYIMIIIVIIIKSHRIWCYGGGGIRHCCSG